MDNVHRKWLDPANSNILPEWELVRDGATRSFNDDELNKLMQGLVYSKPQQSDPVCLVLCGPPGGGKSTCCASAAKVLGLNLDDFVISDGDVLRPYHEGWNKLCHLTVNENGDDIPLGFTDSQELTSKSCRPIKELLIKTAIETKRNFIFTVVKRNHKDRFLSMAMENGYKVHVIGLVVTIANLRERNIKRAEKTGRWVQVDGVEEKVRDIAGKMTEISSLANGEIIIYDNNGEAGQQTILYRFSSGQMPGELHQSLLDHFGLPGP